MSFRNLKVFQFLVAFWIINTLYADDEFKGNKQWCTPPKSNIPISTFVLPNQFQTTVESNFRSSDGNFTSEFEEYYDFTSNRGLIVRYVLYEELRQYFLYDTDEMITVIDNVCVVQQLSKNAIGTPFGYEKINGTGHIFSPINALKLQYNQEFDGKGNVRGISVDRIKSCAYIEELKSTVRILWSFSDPFVWNSTLHSDNISLSAPVEMLLEGITDDNEQWIQQYEYIKFRPYLIENKEIFETPIGIYCPGRVPTKPLPKVPNHFSFRIEGTSIDKSLTTNLVEWYDDENKLVRIDSQTLTDEDIAAFGKTSITEIHDFRRGIRFIFDRKTEQCLNYTTLDPLSPDSDSDSVNNTNFVKLRPALELFNFDKNNSLNYQYHGTKKVRDIECDVWIALRENWPPHPTINRISTWEWYFMSSEWTANNHGAIQKSIPVKLIVTHYNQEIVTNKYITTTIVYNYFDYEEEKPEIFTFDLHNCFTDLQMKQLIFTLDLPYSKLIKNKREFRYKIGDGIAKATYLLPTRVTNIDILERNNQTMVTFKLLDKLPIKGNVLNPVEDISLDDAYSQLKKSINEGKILITVNNVTFKAIPESLEEVLNSRNTKSLQTSTNASTIYIGIGTAFGGFLFGIVLVIIIINLVHKKNSNEPALSMSGLINSNFKA